jgi:hypothetical protein
VEVAASARKHGLSDADILHAWRNMFFAIEQEYGDESRMFVIGPARDGSPLELVAVSYTQPTRIIHADRMRPKFRDLLR